VTFPPSDSPDWTGIPGALRYLGSIDMSASLPGDVTGTLDVTPASYDGVIYVVATGDPNSVVGNATVELDHLPDGAFTNLVGYYRTGLYKPEVFSAFINAAIGGTWQVQANIIQTGGSDWTLYVFAAPAPNSVLISPTQGPILVQGVPMYPRDPDAYLTSAPAAATRAVVTFAAVPNQRWVLNQAIWTYRSAAAVASAQTIRVTSAAAGDRYVSVMSIPATANAIDREQIGPGVGIAGTFEDNLTVDFQAAGPANTFERISASAWLLPPGF
jgi:hypothetical protein